MEKQTVFIKRYPSNGELPKIDGKYMTDRFSDLDFNKTNECVWFWNEHIKYWLEEIELPSEEEIFEASPYEQYTYDVAFELGANFILNHLKSNTNETDKI